MSFIIPISVTVTIGRTSVLSVYFPPSIQPVHNQTGVAHNMICYLILPAWVPIPQLVHLLRYTLLPLIFFLTCPILITISVPTLRRFAPSLVGALLSCSSAALTKTLPSLIRILDNHCISKKAVPIRGHNVSSSSLHPEIVDIEPSRESRYTSEYLSSIDQFVWSSSSRRFSPCTPLSMCAEHQPLNAFTTSFGKSFLAILMRFARNHSKLKDAFDQIP